MSTELQHYRQKLRCSVRQVDDIFAGCVAEGLAVFSTAGFDAYLDGASVICNLGRGQELVLIFLEGMPEVARHCGEVVTEQVVETARLLSRTANARAINPFLATLPACARRLGDPLLMSDYLLLVRRMAEEAAEGLTPLLQQVEYLLGEVSVGGLRNWMEQGLEGYGHQPWRYGDYFSLQTADSRAALQRERRGTLFIDHERRIEHYLHAFWSLEIECHPYSLAFDIARKRVPFIDKKGFHLPDVYEDLHGVRGIDRYRALLAHMVAHKLYTRPLIADNLSPWQQLAVETFEDSRVEALAMRRYPGLRRLWQQLHPIPKEGACPPDHSSIRHRLAMLSRAILDPAHGYSDPLTVEFAQRFQREMGLRPEDPHLSVELGIAFLSTFFGPDLRLPKIWFTDTEVSYRDDNRWIWIFLEDTDEEDDFHSDHAAANPKQDDEEEQSLFVRHLREWDAGEQRYHHDWVTVQETIQPQGDPRVVEAILERHKPLVKQLTRIVDLLKPQQYKRVRYQEEGDELDLDVAIRTMVDFRAGSTPDPRIHMSHESDGRDIAVVLLLDLSESIKQAPPGCEHTILQLSQEAVALLAVAIDALGDPFAIAGFASNTRHQVNYLHFKGFNEAWGEAPMGRIAAMAGGLSTRMGAAIRTAGHYLSRRDNEKRLLLVLSDGEPHDVDVTDPAYLRADTKRAVEELSAQGVATYCITLDPQADEYVAEIFGKGNYTVVDRVERLPERLPKLFMALTR